MGEAKIGSVQGLAKLIRARLRADLDQVVGICSYEGVGKSNLGILLGQAVDPKFDLNKSVVYIPKYDEVADRVTKLLPKFSALLVDEAIKVTYKRTWQSRRQVFLNQLFAICRKQNLCTILCMPRFGDFDLFWRQHRITLWIEILKRGYAVAFIPDWSPFKQDIWNSRLNQTMIDKSTRKTRIAEVPFDMRVNILRDSPNYFMEFPIPRVDSDVYAEYLKLNEGYRMEMVQEAEPSSTIKYRAALKRVAKYLHDNGLVQQDIADLVGVTQATISTWIK